MSHILIFSHSSRRVLCGRFVCQTRTQNDLVSGIQLQDNTGAIDSKVCPKPLNALVKYGHFEEESAT